MVSWLVWGPSVCNPSAGEAEAATLQDQNHNPGVHAETLPSPKRKQKRLKHLEPWPTDPHGSMNAAL